MMALRKTGLGPCRRLKRPPIPYSRLTQERFFKNLKIEESTVGIIAPRHCIYMHISVFQHLRGAISISEIRNPVRVLDPGSWIQDPGSWIQDPGSWILDPRSRILDPGSWIQDPGSRILDPWSKNNNDIKCTEISLPWARWSRHPFLRSASPSAYSPGFVSVVHPRAKLT